MKQMAKLGDDIGLIAHTDSCGAWIMRSNRECDCGATFEALIERNTDTDYGLLREVIGEHLARFIEEDDVAEVAILCAAIEKAAKHIAWLEAETPEKRS